MFYLIIPQNYYFCTKLFERMWINTLSLSGQYVEQMQNPITDYA